MKNRHLLFLTGAVAIITGLIVYALTGNNGNTRFRNDNKRHVIASFYPMYFFTSEIGGEKAEIKNLTPAGIEPHEYELSLQDITRIEKSQMLVLNGAIETWADKIKNNLKDKNIKIVTAGAGLISKRDPHVWLSPPLAKKQIEAIAQGFISIDSSNKNYYLNNQKALNERLDKLDREYKEGLSSCQHRDFITSHTAFSYLADHYGLSQISISGLSPDQEPAAARLTEIIRFARERKIKYIFFERLASPKLSETIAEEVGAKTLVLDPIEGISDTDKSTGKNYFTLMENNLNNLKLALGCK